MEPDRETQTQAFLSPARLYSRADVLDPPCPVPAAAGVYGWWFDPLRAAIDTTSCRQHDGHTLLYTGISPRRPPGNGRAPSRQTMRGRIRTHYTGNAEGSTLRKTLGCLLADEFGLELRRVGSGTRMTFLAGERALSQWMHTHARVSAGWRVRRPGGLEDHLIGTLDLPLNLEGNAGNAFHASLSQARAAAVLRAKGLPLAHNPGIGGR